MIIPLIIVFTAGTVWGFLYLKRVRQWLVGGLFMVLLVACVVGLMVHDTNHWGMHEVTSSSTKTIYSASAAMAGSQAGNSATSGSDGSASTAPAFGILIKQGFGTDSSTDLFMYAASQDAKAVTVNFLGNTKALDVTDKGATATIEPWIKSILSKDLVETTKKSMKYQLVDSDSPTARIVTHTSTWQFDSQLMRVLFGVGGEEGSLVRQSATVEVPRKSWLVLTQAQVEALEKKLPALQAQAKAQAAAAQAQVKAAVTTAVQQAVNQAAASPQIATLPPAEQKAALAKVAAEAQTQATQAAEAQLKATLAAASTPQAQMDAIKKAMGW